MDVSALNRREVASILFKHGKLLVSVFVAVFVIVFGGSYLLTPKYKAEAQLLIQSGREFQVVPEKGENLPTVPYMTKQEVVNSEVQILQSEDLIESVIRAMGLKRLYPEIAGDGDSEAEQMSEAADKFNRNFEVEPVTMSNIVILRYWNPDRQTAIDTVQKLSDLYQQKHIAIFGDKQSGFLEAQTNDYEKQLENVTAQIASLKVSQQLSDIVYEREQLIQDRSDLESKLRDLKSQSIDAHRTIDYYQNQLKSMPELVLANENSADAVETAKARLLDLNTQLLQLEERYTPDNPEAAGPIADLKTQIAQIQAFIDNPALNEQKQFGRNTTYDDARLKLQNAQADAPALDQQIAYQEGELNKILARLKQLDEGQAKIEVLDREHDELQELVHTYRTRYEDSRIDEDLDKQKMISVNMVQAPLSDDKPDKPNHVLFAGIGLAGGVLSVALAILYLLVYRESLITTESLERTLNLRVIGVVPDIANPQSGQARTART
jgi:uncharacterized protein involved in exopolysaccharide biosynthesis